MNAYRVLCLVFLLFSFSGIAAADAPSGAESEISESTTPVNINAASRATLSTRLKGIGPSKAEAIVRYREKYGAFESVDALVNVKGIGPKTLEKLREKLVAGEFKVPAKGDSLEEQEAAARAAVQAIVKRSNELRQSALNHD